MYKRIAAMLLALIMIFGVGGRVLLACVGDDTHDHIIDDAGFTNFLEELLEALGMSSIEELEEYLDEFGWINLADVFGPHELWSNSWELITPFCINFPMTCCGNPVIERHPQIVFILEGRRDVDRMAAIVDWCHSCWFAVRIVASGGPDSGNCICRDVDRIRTQPFWLWR